ncbi:MAG: hypothetical protein V7K77_16585 [Nostoc sp.]|uniref:hypothetical protein n=1 Tax=Nostoc sp. TaxID=1180 RepID=UPI002FF9DB76
MTSDWGLGTGDWGLGTGDEGDKGDNTYPITPNSPSGVLSVELGISLIYSELVTG